MYNKRCKLKVLIDEVYRLLGVPSLFLPSMTGEYWTFTNTSACIHPIQYIIFLFPSSLLSFVLAF